MEAYGRVPVYCQPATSVVHSGMCGDRVGLEVISLLGKRWRQMTLALYAYCPFLGSCAWAVVQCLEAGDGYATS